MFTAAGRRIFAPFPSTDACNLFKVNDTFPGKQKKCSGKCGQTAAGDKQALLVEPLLVLQIRSVSDNLGYVHLSSVVKPVTTSDTHLLLQSLQGFELQAGQSDLNVFGNVWDQEAQHELEGQQHVLKSQEREKRRIRMSRARRSGISRNKPTEGGKRAPQNLIMFSGRQRRTWTCVKQKESLELFQLEDSQPPSALSLHHRNGITSCYSTVGVRLEEGRLSCGDVPGFTSRKSFQTDVIKQPVNNGSSREVCICCCSQMTPVTSDRGRNAD